MIPNIQIEPSTQVCFQQFVKFIPSLGSTPAEVTFEILRGTVISDNGEFADVLVNDVFHNQKHYHVNHKNLFYDIGSILTNLNPAPSFPFDDLLKGASQ